MIRELFSKTRYICLLSFFTAAVIFAAVISAGGVYPFGESCILRTDMYHQYAPFMAELSRRLKEGGSLGFTWNLGLGVNFSAIIAYYLASPFNLLIFFVGQDYTIEFMTVMVILKVGLSGAAMAAYLDSHAACGERVPAGYAAFLMSLFYALSGYMCAYYWNVMWLDSIACFPLAVLGLERLIEGKRGYFSGILYGAALGYCIFTNYYISIFICIFLVLYFFAWNILHTPESPPAFIRGGLRFFFWSLLAAGLAAVMLLPEIAAFRHTVSSESSFPAVFNDYFSIIRELSRHLPLIETEQGLDHWPNIYCGTGIVLLFFLYIRSRRISLREKTVYITLALVFLASFAVNVLNFIWHGMHYPNSLPARQSFIYIFLVLFMGWRVITGLDSITRRELWESFFLAVCFILVSQELMRSDDAYAFFVFYAALILTAVYAGLIHAYRKKLLLPGAALALVSAVALVELCSNTAYTSITITSRTSFMSDNDDVRYLTEKAYGDAGDDEFVRIERSSRKSKNDGAWLGFPSASIFSSMANADCSDLFRQLGCEASVNAYSITGSTPLVDMLLGIDYELTASSNGSNEVNDFVESAGDVVLYRNKYALAPGYMMPDGMLSAWELTLDDPAQVQNSLFSALKLSEFLVPVYSESDASDGEFSVTISDDGLYYAYEANTKAGDVTVRWSDRRKTFGNLDRKYFIELGQLERGDIISFTAKEEKDPEITIYRADADSLREAYSILAAQQLKVTDYGDGYLNGSITVDTGALGYISDRGKMLITTPYDEGWTVMVDGEKTETSPGLGAFLSFYISSGTHQITMEYEPAGLRAGAAVSIICLIILLTSFIIARKRKS